MTARDTNGAIRFLNFGNLPFDKELKAFHRELMTERRRSEGYRDAKFDFLIIEQDVMRIARGQYDYWPLDLRP